MADAGMLDVADHQHRSLGKGMKRIGDHRLERQTSGIMTYPLTEAASVPPPSIR
jgi:hypothetical protein